MCYLTSKDSLELPGVEMFIFSFTNKSDHIANIIILNLEIRTAAITLSLIILLTKYFQLNMKCICIQI